MRENSGAKEVPHRSDYDNLNTPVVAKFEICLSRTDALTFSEVLFYPSEYPTPRQQPMAGEGGTMKQPAEYHMQKILIRQLTNNIGDYQKKKRLSS